MASLYGKTPRVGAVALLTVIAGCASEEGAGSERTESSAPTSGVPTAPEGGAGSPAALPGGGGGPNVPAAPGSGGRGPGPVVVPTSNPANGGSNPGAGGTAPALPGAGGSGVAGSAAGGTPPGASGANAGGNGPVSEGGSAGIGGPVTNDVVTRSESTVTFEHYPIEAGADGVWTGAMTPGQTATSTTFDTVVLENGYLRVTVLPSYGGRVLSIVHKPTDTELLYQNPVGTPYLMYEGIFYYDYLVILGGIFPSFPEPEHGKYWNLPYEFEVVSESPEAITVRMSRQDDRDMVEGVPEQYDVGRTDVLVEVEVTLRAGSSALEFDTRLTNTRDSEVPAFEYWTVTTLAPGSTPGSTAIPLETRIVAEMEQVRLLESSWAWFGEAEERVSGEVFRWNNLSHFENWEDQGTGFANPSYSAGWSGLINYQNDHGILRVSENVETPGLKLWTFGKQSLDVDLADSTQWLRPTIEMWHGVTPEFWERGSLAPNEVKEWSERYFPTFGLREVTAASDHGALQLSRTSAGADSVLAADATLTLPDQTVHAVLRVDGNVVLEEDVVVAADAATRVEVTVPSAEAPAGALFEAEFRQGESSLLAGQLTLE